MKVTTYILLFYFTLGAFIPKSDFSQLLKVNNLLEHYDLHQAEAFLVGETVDFIDFLYIHFIAGDEHRHGDDTKHDKLPLHNIASSITFYIQSIEVVSLSLPVFHSSELPAYLATRQEMVTFDIFHPPSIA